MFTVPGQANPLAAFAGGAAQQIAQNEERNSLQRLQQESNRKKNESVLKAFQTHNLNEKSSALDWMKAINDIDDPEAKKTAMDQYETIQKTIESERKSLNDERTEKRERDKLAQTRELEEIKEAGRNKRAQDIIKSKEGQEKKDTNAKLLIEAEDDLLKANQALDSLDRLENVGEDLSSSFPIVGYAKTAIDQSARAEYGSLGKAVIQPVVKLFNPAGPIPQAKLEWLEKTFVPSPWETKWTQKGKVDAMRRIVQHGKERAQQRLSLLKAGKTSEQELNEFDRESSQLLDTVSQYEAGKISQESNERPPGLYKNKKTGKVERWDGQKWNPQ